MLRSTLLSLPRAAKRSCRRLRFELLEYRRVPATFTVTTLSDAAVTGPGSAPGTLRQAVFDANNLPGADSIKFAPELSGVVNLSIVADASMGASALLVTSPITILGNANGITIGRNPSASAMRLFRVSAAGNLSLEAISLTGGIARGADATFPGEAGGFGRGGAIWNDGMLTIVGTTFHGNQAAGGNAGAAAPAGAGLGGALFNAGGAVTSVNSTFSSRETHHILTH